MRRMAATVSIITTRWNGIAYGMTATSVTALSMSPPSLMIAINQEASMHDTLMKAGAFWVNLLCEAYNTELSVFIGRLKGPERFRYGQWCDQRDIPRLVDAQANILCRIVKTVPFATHTIVAGTVIEALARENVNPLIDLDGKPCTSYNERGASGAG